MVTQRICFFLAGTNETLCCLFRNRYGNKHPLYVHRVLAPCWRSSFCLLLDVVLIKKRHRENSIGVNKKIGKLFCVIFKNNFYR